MRSFAQMDRVLGRVPAAVVTALRRVDIGQGTEALYRDRLPGLLESLADRARVASITASSAIEGVVVADSARERAIVQGRPSSLRTRSEQELAGYRDALDYLFQRDWRPLNVGLLLHLHRLLFSYTPAGGGHFKADDNLVVDRSPDGTMTVRFRPVPAAQTEFFMHELVDRYLAANRAGTHHPVLLVGLFVLDLTIIHPFEDGNGRVARVLANALLADEGYTVVRYLSLEHEDAADPWPWLAYFVGVLATAYDQFSQRTAADRSGGTKQERVRDYLLRHAPPVFRMADVRAALPGISDPTIRLVLQELRQRGMVDVDGTGRSALWRRIDAG